MFSRFMKAKTLRQVTSVTGRVGLHVVVLTQTKM